MQDINLLPQSEISEQTKVRVVNFSTIVSIIFVICFAGFSGYVLLSESSAKKQLADLDSKIKYSRDQITSKAEVEVIVRNLDKKYTALQNIFKNRKKYSALITELKARKPSNLEFTNVDVKEGKVGINGKADNYISIAEFVRNLINKDFQGGGKGLEALFTSVSLNSVNMESSRNSIQFFMVIDFSAELLK